MDTDPLIGSVSQVSDDLLDHVNHLYLLTLDNGDINSCHAADLKCLMFEKSFVERRRLQFLLRAQQLIMQHLCCRRRTVNLKTDIQSWAGVIKTARRLLFEGRWIHASSGGLCVVVSSKCETDAVVVARKHITEAVSHADSRDTEEILDNDEVPSWKHKRDSSTWKHSEKSRHSPCSSGDPLKILKWMTMHIQITWLALRSPSDASCIFTWISCSLALHRARSIVSPATTPVLTMNAANVSDECRCPKPLPVSETQQTETWHKTKEYCHYTVLSSAAIVTQRESAVTIKCCLRSRMTDVTFSIFTGHCCEETKTNKHDLCSLLVSG